MRAKDDARILRIFGTLVGLAPSSLHDVVASSLPSIDVKNLTCHKPSAIEVEHRVHNVGHISHPTIGWSPAKA
jgi:hypothetical protein